MMGFTDTSVVYHGWNIDDVVLSGVAPIVSCPADLAPPQGVLDFFDVSAFLAAYNTQQPPADFAAPFGVFDFFDVSAFLASYNAGCP
jgi:hypothetical protein